MLTELRTPTLAEEAARRIRESIIAGEFQHGERLVEVALAKRLGTSRGTVRQALRRVGNEGLVREEPRRGVFVVRLSPAELREIYELRAALEARAARLLIESIGRNDGDPNLRDLERILERMDAAADREDGHALAEADLEFHQTICRLSGNSRLHDVFARESSVLRTLMEAEIARYMAFYSSLNEIVEEHRELLAAIRAKDSQRAERLVDDHLARSWDHSVELAGGQGTAATGS